MCSFIQYTHRDINKKSRRKSVSPARKSKPSIFPHRDSIANKAGSQYRKKRETVRTAANNPLNGPDTSSSLVTRPVSAHDDRRARRCAARAKPGELLYWHQKDAVRVMQVVVCVQHTLYNTASSIDRLRRCRGGCVGAKRGPPVLAEPLHTHTYIYSMERHARHMRFRSARAHGPREGYYICDDDVPYISLSIPLHFFSSCLGELELTPFA